MKKKPTHLYSLINIQWFHKYDVFVHMGVFRPFYLLCFATRGMLSKHGFSQSKSTSVNIPFPYGFLSFHLKNLAVDLNLLDRSR